MATTRPTRFALPSDLLQKLNAQQQQHSDGDTEKQPEKQRFPYLRHIYIVICVATFLLFVIATCMVMITIALYSDSKTLDTLAKQGQLILTTVQQDLAAFNDTQLLPAVGDFVVEWTDVHAPTLERVALAVANTTVVIEQIVNKIRAGNTTALVGVVVQEASQFVAVFQTMLTRLQSVFQIDSQTLSAIGNP